MEKLSFILGHAPKGGSKKSESRKEGGKKSDSRKRVGREE